MAGFTLLNKQQMLEIDLLQQQQQIQWKAIPCAGQQVDFDQLDLLVMPGVYPPGEAARLLVEHLPSGNDLRVLDLGTGTGALALVMALRGASSVVATDIAGAAAYNARQNVQRLQQDGVVEVRSGNMFSCISRLEKFDLILANLPGRNKLAGDETEATQWDTDFKAHYALFEEAPHYLLDKGAIYLVMANYPDLPLTLELAQENAFKYEVVSEKKAEDGDPRIHYVLKFYL